jgi:hypothetical protein
MRHLILAAAITVSAASAVVPSPAAAQAAIQLSFDLPVVLPRMVVIEPGIQVVPGVNEEVFFVDGYYWTRRDARWYRSHDHRRGWSYVETHGVPPRLVRIPGGHYRRWDEKKGHHDQDQGDRGRGHEKNDRDQKPDRDQHRDNDRRDKRD